VYEICEVGFELSMLKPTFWHRFAVLNSKMAKMFCNSKVALLNFEDLTNLKRYRKLHLGSGLSVASNYNVLVYRP
jgi:hypothetical protein